MDQLRKLPNYSSTSSCPSSSSIQDLTDRPNNNKTSSNHKSRTLHTSITMSKALLLTSCFLLLSITTNGMYSVSALPDDSSSSSVRLSLFGSAIESNESMAAPITSSQVATAAASPPPSPFSSLTSTFEAVERTVTGTNETLDVDWPRSVEAGSNPTPNVKVEDVDDDDDDERTTTMDNQSTQIDTIDRTIESSEQSPQTQPPPIELSASTVDDAPAPQPKRTAKVLKVVKKMKRSKAKQWNRLDSGTDDDRSQHKWISLFEAKQTNNNKQKRWPRKSSKRIVCLHVLPSKKEQTEMEQFNLVRKCYSVKHIKRAEATTLDTSSVPNYSPIIDPGQLMVRSPMMDPSGSEWAPVRTSPFEEPKPIEPETQTTETATILPQNSNQTDDAIDTTTITTTTEETPKSVSLISDVREEVASPQTNYLNLYEYQTTNPLIDQNVDTNVDKPLDIGVETLENGNKANQNETQHDRMDQSSSEFFPIVTNIVTIGDQNVEASNIENEQAQQQPAPVLHHNNISNEKETKDLWQVNRRKKQLKEMTMASRASSHHPHESTSSPVTDSNDTSASRLGSHSRRIPKLLVFKANRPAMYSLNGYVPKPSLHRVAAQLPQRRSSQAEANRLTKSSRNKRRRKNKKVYEDDDDESGDERDEIEVSESVSHHRRRFEPNSLTPSAANNKTKKQKKATGLLRGQGPWLNSVPKTSFECNEQTIDGVYADIETGCQAWHVCQNGAQHSFLCPAGTIFNAKNGVCDWWYNTRCA